MKQIILLLIAAIGINYAFPQGIGYPGNWFPLGAATMDNYQQCFGYGHFDNATEKKMVGSYSHSAVGMLLHHRINNTWIMSVLHPRFDPDTNLHIKGMLGTWPVKGFTSGDYDGDGRDEIITYADQIMYPPAHGDTVYPFPACIYIDFNPDSGFTANPLFWGSWGESDASNIVSVMRVTPVSTDFRDTVHPPGLKDFLVNTLWYNASKFKGKLYLLEQPAGTFNSVDFRYIHPGVTDTGNLFSQEPFYLHHLYVNNGTVDTEIVFTPDDYPPSSSAWCTGNVWDYDHDGMMDLAVAVSYQKGDTQICASVRVFHRLASITGKSYRFEQVFRKDIPNTNFWELIPANLNGNPLDGKEAWVMNARISGGSNNFGVCGIASLQHVALDSFLLLGTYAHNPQLMAEEYISTYSSAAVIDADNDGCDDAAVVMIKPDNHGDIVLFRNLKWQLRNFPELFCADNGNSRVLWDNHHFTWDLHTGDFDDDEADELGAAEALKQFPELKIYNIHYSDITWANLPDLKVRGKLIYNNSFNTPISNTKLYMKTLTGLTVDSAVTDGTGRFKFYCQVSGPVVFDALINMAPGGINSIDALLILKHYTGLISFSGINLQAADVNASGNVNSIDALLTAQRFVNTINTFPPGDWVIAGDTIIMGSTGTINHDLKVLCYGDVNSSFVPIGNFLSGTRLLPEKGTMAPKSGCQPEQFFHH